MGGDVSAKKCLANGVACSYSEWGLFHGTSFGRRFPGCVRGVSRTPRAQGGSTSKWSLSGGREYMVFRILVKWQKASGSSGLARLLVSEPLGRPFGEGGVLSGFLSAGYYWRGNREIQQSIDFLLRNGIASKKKGTPAWVVPRRSLGEFSGKKTTQLISAKRSYAKLGSHVEKWVRFSHGESPCKAPRKNSYRGVLSTH